MSSSGSGMSGLFQRLFRKKRQNQLDADISAGRIGGLTAAPKGQKTVNRKSHSSVVRRKGILNA